MKLIHNIGPRHNSNYNTREEILACKEPLGIDGVYRNVYINRDVLVGKDVILFVMGNYCGKDNRFDVGMPRENYCTWEQLEHLVGSLGCKLGWHTWSHPDLTKISIEEALYEITPPFPMDYFAYPYGAVNEAVEELVKLSGFKEAWSVHQGDGSQWQRNRTYLNW